MIDCVCLTVLLLILDLHFFFFFFNDTATTEIYTLSLHDALPISPCYDRGRKGGRVTKAIRCTEAQETWDFEVDPNCEFVRSEEHTSELQSRQYLVCRLLLEKKKKNHNYHHVIIVIHNI